MKLLSIDTETTGLDHLWGIDDKPSVPLSIGWRTWEANGESLKPDFEVEFPEILYLNWSEYGDRVPKNDEGAYKINKISDEYLSDMGVSPEEAYDRMLGEFKQLKSDGGMFHAFNAMFDINIVHNMARYVEAENPEFGSPLSDLCKGDNRVRILCSMMVEQYKFSVSDFSRIMTPFGGFSLARSIQRAGIPDNEDAHSADSDTAFMIKLFQHQRWVHDWLTEKDSEFIESELIKAYRAAQSTYYRGSRAQKINGELVTLGLDPIQ